MNYDIVCLNETWLNNNVFDGEFGFNDYNLYTGDRNLTYGKLHGDGIDAVNKKICCELLHGPLVTGIEPIFLKFTVNKIKIVLGYVYITCILIIVTL